MIVIVVEFGRSGLEVSCFIVVFLHLFIAVAIIPDYVWALVRLVHRGCCSMIGLRKGSRSVDFLVEIRC